MVFLLTGTAGAVAVRLSCLLNSGYNQRVTQRWWGNGFQYLLVPTKLGELSKILEANCLENQF